MKTLFKVALVAALLAAGAVGWMQWRNKEVRPQAGRTFGTTKGKVNEEHVNNAERLAARLRAVQRTAATNQETKGK